jgi:hypothetical protein
VTREPDFEELLGEEVSGPERRRLQRVHELLVAAGPPPELSPELEAGPNMAVTFRRRRAQSWRRPALLAAALVALALAAFGGYLAGNGSRSSKAFSEVRTVAMRGTAAAPSARATIAIGENYGENWPMRFVATGLPKLEGGEYYEVWLVRNGKVIGPCGGFLVRNGSVRTYLNAPYKLGPGSGWSVTRQTPGVRKPGEVVLTT